jgi:hypothetical protein
MGGNGMSQTIPHADHSLAADLVRSMHYQVSSQSIAEGKYVSREFFSELLISRANLQRCGDPEGLLVGVRDLEQGILYLIAEDDLGVWR